MPAVHRTIRRVRRPGPLVAVSVAYLVLVSGVMIWHIERELFAGRDPDAFTK